MSRKKETEKARKELEKIIDKVLGHEESKSITDARKKLFMSAFDSEVSYVDDR